MIDPDVAPEWAPEDVNSIEFHVRNMLQFLRDDEFITTIAEWSWDWCLEFPKEVVSVHSVEHTLECTEAHRQYCELFEERAQLYLAHHGLVEANFLELVVQVLRSDGASATDFSEVLEGLVASASYESFFVYMSTVRRRREFAERTMCTSADSVDWVELVRRALCSNLGDVTVGDDIDVQFLD
mmetsp:Transcript_7389/g.10647  ORF Transcript_7389/g.10647 Transcript_7389/m.10647 type:complete len:183 (+) Transcript_7389:3-551(+)